MRIASMWRRCTPLFISLSLFIFVGQATAATPYEPRGFTPPPNLLQAAGEAKTASALTSPLHQVAMPTSGPTTTAYRSPWVQEKEFGNSQPMGKSGFFQSQDASLAGGKSALQGGTTMMLSTLPTAVGRIPATYDVSPTGAAHYTIPIWTPPGARGIEPKLALQYSSTTPDSLMGPGWKLSGLSTIVRCPKTIAQDGVREPVHLDSTDRFCLDGNRLRLTGGNYGATNSTYQTELDTFSKVTLLGSGDTMNFEVRSKDGLIYEYGNTVDSRVAGEYDNTPYLWSLNKIRDRQGNNLTISYTLSDGTYRPSVIAYTQTVTDSTYHYRVIFGYQSRSAIATSNQWFAGSEIRNTQALTTITITHDLATVRQYNIDYSTGSATQKLRVSAVQTCSTSDCLKPTVITYQEGTAGIAAPTTSSGSGATSGQVSTVDIDGDGRDDLVYSTASGSNRTWYVKFATASGFGAAVATGLTTTSSTAVLFDDFLGNNRSCLLGLQGSTWYADCWNGSSFTLASTSITLASGTTGAPGEYVTADTDGDGRADLIRSDLSKKIYIRLNSSSGSSVSFSSSEYLALDTATYTSMPSTMILRLQGNNSVGKSSVHHVDYNGDGAEDVVVFMQTTGWSGPLSYALTASGTTLNWRPPGGDTQGAITTTPIKFNDDNCTDFLNTFNAPGSSDSINVSPCGGDSGTWVSTGINHALAADHNGDGRTDIWYASGGVLQVMLSQGDSLAAAISTGISAGSGSYQTFDQNGDGLDDLAYVDPSASYAVNYGLHNGAGTKPDLATTIADGFEMSVSFSYKPITATGSGICYYRDSAAPAFPSRAFMGPLYTACTTTASNGIGGTYQVAYSYYNANTDLQGRGFLGFERRYAIDNRNSIVNMEAYSQTFPFIGMPTYSLVRQPDWIRKIKETSRTTAELSFGSGDTTRKFPYFSQTNEDAYEVGGSLDNQWITRTTTSTSLDSYGNPTTVTVATTDKSTASPFYSETYTVQTVNTITNDTTYWCLGRPSQTTATSTLPNSTAQTRTTSATVDYVNCRNTQETLEPSSSTLKVVTTYGFDSCGNVNSTSVVGKNPDGTDMATRTTTSSYGTRCQLPESVTNALSQTSSTAYNYAFGLPSSQTDPNGISVSWTYDNYGRKIQENRPDGTYTAWVFGFCHAANSYCGVSDLRSLIMQIDYNTAAAIIHRRHYFFDGLEHMRVDAELNLAGTFNPYWFAFDSMGRTAIEYGPAGGCRQFTYDLISRTSVIGLYALCPGQQQYSLTALAYAGRQISVTDARSNIITKYFDVRGKLRRIDDPSPGGTSTYEYDHFGNLSKTIDAINAQSIATYNILGFKTGSNDDDAGAWTYTSNSLGEIVYQQDAKGTTTTFAYDKLSRMTSRTEAEGTSTWTWGTSSTLKNIGQLESVSGPGYSEGYSYDSLGRPSQTTYNADTAYYFDYAYNSSTGFLDNVTYPTSTSGYRLRIQYQYQNGILNQIRDYNVPSTVWWQLNAQDARSNPIDEQFGNGVHALSNNDVLTNHLNWRTSGNNAQYNNHQNITYEWDKNENLKKRIDVSQSNLTEEFFYDALDRLYESKLNSTTNLTVSLNAAGNITQKSDVGSFNYTTAQSGCSYYSHVQPHAVRNAGGVIYCYDQNGNMVKRNGATTSWYSYDLPNTISNGTVTSQFFYGPDRNRWKQLASYGGGSENTIYIGGLMEKVSVSAGTAYRHYIPAGSNTVIYTRWSTGTNKTYYATSDHLGSSTAVTDETGAIIVKDSFAAYGGRRNNSGWSGSPSSGDWTAIGNTTRQGFTGHEHLDNLSLVHMNGRVYDPAIGRFMSADPFIDEGLGSQGLNPYSYVGNKPLSFTDPSGFFGCRGSIVYRSDGSFVFFPSDGASGTLGDCLGSSSSNSYGDYCYPYGCGGYVYIPPSVTQGNVISRFDEQKPTLEEFKASNERNIDELQKALLLGHESKPKLNSRSPWKRMGSDLLEAASVLGGPEGWLTKNALKKMFMREATTVYRSVDAAGQVNYAGITNNFARRAAEQLAEKGIKIGPLMQGLSRHDARAVEQALIEIHGLGRNGGTLLNRINSISPWSPTYVDQLRRGYELLKTIGY